MLKKKIPPFIRLKYFQPCITDHLDIKNVKHLSNHWMAQAMESQGSCSWTSLRNLSSSWYLSVTSNPHTWCSLRRQTGHRNSGWDMASPTELLSFMAQWKYSQWFSPNRWHTSWLTTWKWYNIPCKSGMKRRVSVVRGFFTWKLYERKGFGKCGLQRRVVSLIKVFHEGYYCM